MKKILVISFVALVSFGACNNAKKAETKETKTEVKSEVNTGVMTIDQLYEIAENNIGKDVMFKGMVQHVCSHSGRRAILLNEKGDLSIRVEAKGAIKAFNRELSGSTIVVKGILKEKRLSEEFLNKWEEKVKAKQDAEEGGKHCSSEMNNIKQMREWMKKKNKAFYSIYYVNGMSYEVEE